MKTASVLVAAAVATLAAAWAASAQVPPLISIQGRLLDSDGNPVTGHVVFRVIVHDAPTGGSQLHLEDVGLVPIQNGLYAYTFGTNAAGLQLALTNAECWLEEVVDGEALAPRHRLVSVPYSLRARQVEWVTTNTVIEAGAVTGSALADGAVTSDKLADGSITTNDLSLASVDARYVRKTGDTMTGALAINAGADADLVIDSSGSAVMIGNWAHGQDLGVAVGQAAMGRTGAVAVGTGAIADDHGVAVGMGVGAAEYGAAVGMSAWGTGHGAALGNQAQGASYGVGIGYQAKGSDESVAIGNQTDARGHGVAVGAYTVGSDDGAAVGYGALGNSAGAVVGAGASAVDHGAALGGQARAEDHGVAIGYLAIGQSTSIAVGVMALADRAIAIGASTISTGGSVAVGRGAVARGTGVAVGDGTTADASGTAVGFGSQAITEGTAIGRDAWGHDRGVAIGFEAHGQGTNIAVGTAASAGENGRERIAIGHLLTNQVDDSAALRGTLYLDGGTAIMYRASFGTGPWNNLQDAVETRLTNFVKKAGDTMTGALEINVGPGSNLVIKSTGRSLMIGDTLLCEEDGIAIGPGDVVARNGSVAIGASAIADGSRGTVVGKGAHASGDSVAVGYSAGGGDYSVSIGREANAEAHGFAGGYSAEASDYGVAIGDETDGHDHGVAIGSYAFGYRSGAALGEGSLSHDFGAGVGYNSAAILEGAALGYQAQGIGTSVAVGARSTAEMGGIALGPRSAAVGPNRIAIGQAVTNLIDHSTAVRGTLYLDGGTGIYYRTSFGSGAWTDLRSGLDGQFVNEGQADAITSPMISNGTVAAVDVNAASFSNTFWKVDGNEGTASGTPFLGTTDDQPLELRVHGARALRLEPAVSYGLASPNVIAGHASNVVSAGMIGATISGGGSFDMMVDGRHRVEGHFGTIGGGDANHVAGACSTIAGGQRNQAVQNNSTIGGGEANEASGLGATVGGGVENQADGEYSTVPGGQQNRATAAYGLAAGKGATAGHTGAFVWSDSRGSFASTTNDQFLVSAANGVGIGTNVTPEMLTVAGNVKANSFIGSGSGLTGISGGALAAGSVSNAQLASESVRSANLVDGTISNADLAASAVTSGKIADGTIAADDVNGATFSNTFWKTDGNSGTTTGLHFLGTTDSRPLDVRVHNTRVLRLTPNDNSPDLVGGYMSNDVPDAVAGAVIAGGGNAGYENRASDNFTFIGGGRSNLVGNFAGNLGDAGYAVVVGGYGNRASGYGGAIGGGIRNTASGSDATVPGGEMNTAGGAYSFAAGRYAEALHAGAFVWADTNNVAFSSTAANQFLIRAGGGVGIGTNVTPEKLTVAGNVKADAFIGSGAGLSGISASSLTPGTITTNELDLASVDERYMLKSGDAMGGSLTISAGAGSDLVIDSAGTGVMVGQFAAGADHGTAVGMVATGSTYGVAVGYMANAASWGVAVGQSAQGGQAGTAVGPDAKATEGGIAVGVLADGRKMGIAVGQMATATSNNLALGASATAQNGSNRVAIGQGVVNTVDESTALRGTLYLDGATSILYRAEFGSGPWNQLLTGVNTTKTFYTLAPDGIGVITNTIVVQRGLITAWSP
jgi:hypothetical protein